RPGGPVPAAARGEGRETVRSWQGPRGGDTKHYDCRTGGEGVKGRGLTTEARRHREDRRKSAGKEVRLSPSLSVLLGVSVPLGLVLRHSFAGQICAPKPSRSTSSPFSGSPGPPRSSERRRKAHRQAGSPVWS